MTEIDQAYMVGQIFGMIIGFALGWFVASIITEKWGNPLTWICNKLKTNNR